MTESRAYYDATVHHLVVVELRSLESLRAGSAAEPQRKNEKEDIVYADTYA